MLELTNLYMAHNSKGRKSNSPREADHGKEAAFSTVSLLQGIFLNQGSNPGLLYCRQILYHLSHKGSPQWGYHHPIMNPRLVTLQLIWPL